MEFLSGDTLHGEFLSLDARKGARWRHPAMAGPIEVNLSSLARLRVARSGPTNDYPRQNCLVRLGNGDELLGELVGLDPEKLELETWYGGRLSVPRRAVAAIVPGQSRLGIIYEGPTNLEGWAVPGAGRIIRGLRPAAFGQWRFSNDSLISGAGSSIGREFTFPPLVNIEFNATWRGYFQMAIGLFGDSLEIYGGNSYLLQFNHSAAFLQRFSRQGESASFGAIDISPLVRKSHAHISIRANREKRTIALLVDGILIKQWDDTIDFRPGSHLVFHQQGNGVTKISQIKISVWDGRLEPPAVTPAVADRTEDLIKLVNQDTLTGSLESIQDGRMTVQTTFAALEVPIERVVEIELAGAKAVQLAEDPAVVRLLFSDRGRVTCRLERWEDEQIVGRNPELGQVRFAPGAFSAVDFNLGKKRAEPPPLDPAGPGADDIIIDFD